jgi:hypothetical protein
MSAINPIIHGKDGINRFRDYVSSMPEFLRAEDDVVELVRFFSDYINNAYRNVDLATQFRLKLISTESNMGINHGKLDQLKKLFQLAEAKESSIIYLTNDPTTRVRYYFSKSDIDGDLSTSLLSGTINTTESSDVYTCDTPHYLTEDNIGSTIEFNSVSYEIVAIVNELELQLDQGASGVNAFTYTLNVPNGDFILSNNILYTVTSTFTLNTVGVTKNHIDTYQDPFTRTLNDDVLTILGDAPRMIEFNVSSISDVRARRLKNTDGSVSDKFEVFLDVNIFNIHSVSSVDTVDLDGNPDTENYLVDYYNTFPLYDYSTYSAKHHINFANSSDSFDISDKGLGLGYFYVRDITKSDSVLGDIGLDGINRYVDPKLYETFDAEYPSDWEVGVTFKKGEFTRYNGVRYKVVSDHTSSTGNAPGSSDLYEYYVELWHSISENSTQLVDMYKISFKDDVYFYDYLNFNVGDLIYRYELGDKLNSDKATIVDVNNTEKYIIVSDIVGDIISNGEFVVINNCDEVVKKASFDNNATMWNPNNTTPYNIGDKVVYNNMRYSVIRSHKTSDKSLDFTPEKSDAYALSMSELYVSDVVINRNPYMWGGYKGVYSDFEEKVNLDYTYDNLDDILYVQQVEELELNIKHDQRRWLFNPTVSDESELTRNGFMSVVAKSVELSEVRMTIDPINGPTSGVTVASTAHPFEVGDLVFIETDNGNFNGEYTVLTILTNEFTVQLTNPQAYNPDTGVAAYQSDIVFNSQFNGLSEGDTVYSRLNLVESSDTNPEYSPSGTYYRYYLNDIESEHTSSYDMRVFSNTISDNEAQIEYISEYPGILQDEQSEVELLEETTCSYYYDGIGSLYVATDDIVEIISCLGDGNSPNTVTVVTLSAHNLNIGDIFNVKLCGAYSEYNVVVTNVIDTSTFEYETTTHADSVIFNGGFISSGGVPHGLSTGDYINTYSVTTDFDINRLNVLKFDDYTVKYTQIIVTANSTDIGTFKLSVGLYDGDVVELVNRSDEYENGKYRIKRYSNWVRLDKKLHTKVMGLVIDADLVTDYDPDFDDSPIQMKTYNESYAQSQVNNGDGIYIIELGMIDSNKFDRPVIENIDTTQPSFTQYNYKFDTNTIASRDDMDSSFTGIPDMGASITEKIERLAYQKDPSVIDYELIGYLGKFLGYDITNLSSDIGESAIYDTDEEREKAVRMSIRSLPQFYTLKNTESGLEMIILMFGIVGDVINMWTDNLDPYQEFIPDYSVDSYRYTKMLDGGSVNLVPTPHFNYRIDITGNYTNELTIEDIKRLNTRIEKYKPINTVFNGLIAYIDETINARLNISTHLPLGRMIFDIGYDLDFNENSDNSCF